MKTVLVLSPDEKYTRQSEGDFLRLKDGRILFVWCRFQGSQEDHAHCELAFCTSMDEGETWSEPRTLIDPAMYGVENIMSVSLMRMDNGDLGLFYLVKVTPIHSRIMLSRSKDEGESFYSHVECSDPNRPFYYVVNNSRIERMKNGRLVIPAAYHPGCCGPNDNYFVDMRSIATFFLSDDDGATWRQSPELVYPPFNDTGTGLQEPGVIECAQGGLRAWFRTDRLCQYESFSVDGGEHWSVAQPTRFSSPASPLEIVRRPETGALYAFWNPIPNYAGREMSRAGWGRIPMVYAVSKDDGMTWSEPIVLSNEEEHGYCYPAAFFTKDNAMLVGYCSGGPEEGICLAQLTIKKVTLEG